MAKDKDVKTQLEKDESEEMAAHRQWSNESRIVFLVAVTIAGVAAVVLRMLRK